MATRRLNEWLAFSIEWNWLWMRRMDGVMDRHAGIAHAHTAPHFLLCKFVYMTNTNSNEFCTFLCFFFISHDLVWKRTMMLSSPLYKCLVSLNYISIAYILYAIDIVCYLFLFGRTATASEPDQKYLRNNWTSRKCLGIELSKLTADAAHFPPLSLCYSFSSIWCSFLLFNKCLATSILGGRGRVVWVPNKRNLLRLRFQFMCDAWNRIENHLLSRNWPNEFVMSLNFCSVRQQTIQFPNAFAEPKKKTK